MSSPEGSEDGIPLVAERACLLRERVIVHRVPGVPLAQDATTALLRAARRLSAERAFVTGPGATATALWAGREGIDLTYWTESLAEARTLKATFAAAGLPSPHPHLSAGYAGLEAGTCDVALVHLPRGRALQEQTLRLAGAMLDPGGRLYFVGATREGVKSAIGAARDLFGRVGVLERKGGYHATLARRPDGPWPKPQVDYAQVEVEVEGTPTLLVGVPGVFAFDRVDEGATSLIGAMQVREGEATLDLGCGTGLVGLAALRRGGEVTLADVSARAVESARRTLASNGYPEAPVRLSVGASAFADATFDVVVTNPPFHKGHGVDFEVARLFIVGAARVLRPGGRLYLVANAFLPYEPWLQERFREVRVAWESPRFKVWRGTK